MLHAGTGLSRDIFYHYTDQHLLLSMNAVAIILETLYTMLSDFTSTHKYKELHFQELILGRLDPFQKLDS